MRGSEGWLSQGASSRCRTHHIIVVQATERDTRATRAENESKTRKNRFKICEVVVVE
jgi:hypothetical protein